MTAVALLTYYKGAATQHVFSVLRCGIPYYITMEGSGGIDRVRSILIEIAMSNPSHDVMLFIDDDIAFDASGYNQILESCRKTQGIVSGLYTTHTFGVNQRLVGQINSNFKCYEDGGLYKAEKVGMGFCAIHRTAIEKMQKLSFPVMINGNKQCHPLFLPMIKDGHYLGEDMAFNVRAVEAGVDIYIDTRPRLTHSGEYAFRLEDMGYNNPSLKSVSVEINEVIKGS